MSRKKETPTDGEMLATLMKDFYEIKKDIAKMKQEIADLKKKSTQTAITISDDPLFP